MKKILITGIEGFVGSHLTNFLLQKKNVRLYGIYINPLSEKKEKIVYYKCDIRDAVKLKKIINTIHPSIVFHLAAQISVSQSIENPQKTMDINVNGTLNLLEATKKYKPKILLVSSSEIYASSARPLTEKSAIEPRSPYALSKLFMEYIGQYYYARYKLPIIIARSFNHTGPGQKPIAICSRFAKKIAEIEKGIILPIIKIGDLTIRRDFLDVRDIAQAYWLALNKCT
ncbi:MAG: GDP-mannose 4,6-dehydratase, partial [Parcubacteria group bacterium]|nr:GDP-mannose 4,6-dehydratase [Parcubacteria group bacterium]